MPTLPGDWSLTCVKTQQGVEALGPPRAASALRRGSNAHLLGTLTLLELRTSVPPCSIQAGDNQRSQQGNLKRGHWTQ